MSQNFLSVIASNVVLSVVYLIPVVLCVKWRLERTSTGNSMKQHFWKECFSAMVLFASLFRCLFWAYQPLWYFKWWRCLPQTLNYHFEAIPSFVVLNIYLSILFFWIEICHSQNTIADLRYHFTITLSLKTALELCVVLVDIFFFPTLIQQMTTEPKTDAQRVISYYITGSYFLISALFLYYGGRVYIRFSHMRHHKLKSGSLSTIKFQSFFCWICFTARAFIVTFTNRIPFLNINNILWVNPVYYIILEVLPLLATLSIYRRRSKERDERHIHMKAPPA